MSAETLLAVKQARARFPFFDDLHWFTDRGPILALHALAPVLYEVSAEAHGWYRGESSGDLLPELEGDLRQLDRLGYVPKRPPAQTHRTSHWLVLNTIHGCNLACTYCFVDQGRFGDSSIRKMSREVGTAAVDLAFEQVPPDILLKVRFYGGEPLMNWALVEHVIRYVSERAAGRLLQFSLLTNGVLIDEEKADFLSRYPVQVQLSIDGDRLLHDQHRKTVGGGPTYDRALHGMRLLQDRRVPILFSGTVHDAKEAELDDVLQKLDRLRISENGDDIRASLNLAYYDQPVESEGYRRLLRQQLRVTQRISNRFLDSPTKQNASDLPMIEDLFLGTSRLPRHCDSLTNGFWVDVDGALYPCHKNDYNKDMHYGNVLTGVDWTRRDSLSKRFLEMPEDCAVCTAREMCLAGRGCPIRRLTHGREREAMCDRIRMEQREMIHLYAQLTEEHLRAAYEAASPSPEGMQLFDRALSVRNLARSSTRHIRPLTVFGDWG